MALTYKNPPFDFVHADSSAADEYYTGYVSSTD